MRTSDWVAQAEERLKAAGVETARLDAQMIAAHTLGKSRASVVAHPEEPIPLEDAEPLLARREAREPLAHILGWREFFGRRFTVDGWVLVPRQETEILVEAALERGPAQGPCRVLDLGTGSGCVAVTLALERPDWRVAGADVSAGALEVATRNGIALGTRIEWIESDWFGSLEGRRFDLIVSNPPYIPDATPLMPEVGLHDPKIALRAGHDGLEAYRVLATEAGRYLEPSGTLILELGAGQRPEVETLLAAAGWEDVESRPDLAGIERVILARSPRQVGSII